MKTLCKSFLLALAAAVLINCALAQKPRIANAKLQELSLSGADLKATVNSLIEKAEKQVSPSWIGYRIPVEAKERTMCCFDSFNSEDKSAGKCCLGCRMDSDKGGNFSGTASDCSPPEPVPYAFLFLKVEGKQIGRVRVFSSECPLDFAGLPLTWLEDVKPEQSVELLTGLAMSGDAEATSGKKDSAHNAVMAIAMHDTPAADLALEKLIQPAQPERLREQVVFWLGVQRGKKGVELLRKYAKDDANDRLREKATFAFSQSREPEALKDLIAMARNDHSPHVRGQAIFWLAQIGGKKEAAQITEAIENDPETEVKKKAVFALSQMHNDDSIPLLINLAKTNRNPVVRKQAIFWLGQTHDPRALDFLEELVTK
jgi:HEAT repeat protein